MPKQALHINRFEGGMNTDFAPEDIPDNSLLDALGISVSNIGRIVMPGDPHTVAIQKDSTTITAEESSDNAGYGLFAFNSDYFTDNTEAATQYLAMANGSHIKIWNGAVWNDDHGTIDGFDSDGFDMGAGQTGHNANPSFYAPNGDLRVCDGKFNHTNNFDNNVKWFGFTPKKTIGIGTADATIGGWNVQDASIEGGYPKDSSGFATNAYMADNESSRKGGGGDAYNSGNQRYGYVPGTRDWGIQLAYIPASNSLTSTTFSDSTWMPNTDVNYKFYASYIYDGGQEGSPTPLTMFPTLRGYLPGKIGSESTGDATVTSSENIQFVDRQHEGDDSAINVGIANFSSSGTTVTVTNKFTDTTMDSIDGNINITHDTFAVTDKGILVGQHVFGTGIPTDTYVKTITDATHFVMGDADGADVEATVTDSDGIANGAIGRENVLAVGDKIIVKGTDNFDGTWTVATRDASTFTFIHTSSQAISGTNTEQGYFSKVGTQQAVYFGVGVKFNNDETQDFNFGATSLTASSGGNQRITGSRIYWSSSEDGHGDLWIMFEANFEKGLKAYGIGKDEPTVTNYMPWANTDDNQDDLSVDFRAEGFDFNVWKHPPRYETYESLNGYSHDSKLDAKWKTAVIANGRAYIGNVKRRQKSTFNIKDAALTSGKQAWVDAIDDPTFGDRILKSPVDRFDTFPEEMAIELFGGDDGDSIVKLETFADRIFVFKKNTLHILNVAKDVEILENSYKGMGLDGGLPCQSCLTKTGIAWMNSSGVYHYNGESIESLTDNKIESFWKGKVSTHIDQDTGQTEFWLSNTADVPSIGYDTESNKLIIHKTSSSGGDGYEDILIYDMKIKAWTWLNEALDNENRTNMVNYDGMLIYHEDDGSTDPMLRYLDTPKSPGVAALGAGLNLSVYTKPFDFGTPLQRKKIYKVYVTYRCNATTNVQMQYYTNGDTNTKYNFKTGATNPFLGDDSIALNGSIAEFDTTAGIWETAVLKPATSSEANNVKSFGLYIFNEASAVVDADFEINDITIIYRTKSVK